jgi:hypothetical protein
VVDTDTDTDSDPDPYIHSRMNMVLHLMEYDCNFDYNFDYNFDCLWNGSVLAMVRTEPWSRAIVRDEGKMEQMAYPLCLRSSRKRLLTRMALLLLADSFDVDCDLEDCDLEDCDFDCDFGHYRLQKRSATDTYGHTRIASKAPFVEAATVVADIDIGVADLDIEQLEELQVQVQVQVQLRKD